MSETPARKKINLKVEVNNLEPLSAAAVLKDIRELLENYARENLLKEFLDVTEVTEVTDI